MGFRWLQILSHLNLERNWSPRPAERDRVLLRRSGPGTSFNSPPSSSGKVSGVSRIPSCGECSLQTWKDSSQQTSLLPYSCLCFYATMDCRDSSSPSACYLLSSLLSHWVIAGLTLTAPSRQPWVLSVSKIFLMVSFCGYPASKASNPHEMNQYLRKALSLWFILISDYHTVES